MIAGIHSLFEFVAFFRYYSYVAIFPVRSLGLSKLFPVPAPHFDSTIHILPTAPFLNGLSLHLLTSDSLLCQYLWPYPIYYFCVFFFLCFFFFFFFFTIDRLSALEVRASCFGWLMILWSFAPLRFPVSRYFSYLDRTFESFSSVPFASYSGARIAQEIQ